MIVGEDVMINPNAIIKRPKYVKIGNHVAIDTGVIVATQLHVGDYVHVAPYVVMIGGKDSKVILEDFSFVAAGTKIVAGSDDYTCSGLVGPTIPQKYRDVNYSTVKFEKYSGCGVNCSIMPGVVFGEGAILGANSLATKDLEPWTIYVGNPARAIKARKKETILDYSKQVINERR